MRLIDLTNQVLGEWLVLERGENDSTNHIRWKCKCIKCGDTHLVVGKSLREGTSKSCRSCGHSGEQNGSYKHGLTKHPLSNTFRTMTQRCYNSNNPAYNHYGGKGVTVCESWRGANALENFIADMIPTWFEDAQLDKDKFAKPGEPKCYSPETTCWVTQEENLFIRNNPNLYPISRKDPDPFIQHKGGTNE